MAIVVQFRVENMSAAKYDAVMQSAAANTAAPKGRLYHICYGEPGNLQVIDVFDSPESLEAFGRTLMPLLETSGIRAQPVVSPIHNIVKG